MEIKYRPEIDGLRAIAVLSVILYHAEFTVGSNKLLKGGFLGVDIFFVISGFLITSLIVSELRSTGGFSILNFYERRARRLLPALLTVMLASLPVAWIYLYPTKFIDYLESLIASLFFGSNIYWHITLQEYGTESALLKPFLNTWSLAVEEQFYILYPVIFILIWRRYKQYTIPIFITCLLCSLIFAELLTARDQSLSFYLLPSRIWELLSGGLIAYILGFNPKNDNGSWLIRAMPKVGLVLIIYSLIFIEFDSTHPGIITVIPVVGTVLIISFAGKNDLVTRVLTSKILVGIGLISYSLYLWHYPIFAFWRIVDTTHNELDKVIWISLTFILSIASYYYIEKPFRRKNVVSFRLLASTVATSSLFVVVISISGIQNNGLKGRFTDLIQTYGKNEFDNGILNRESWTVLNNLASSRGYDRSKPGSPSYYEKSVLWYSDNPETIKILVLGNSHGKDLYNAFYQNANSFTKSEYARFAMAGTIPDKQITELINSPNFKSSDLILISFKYTKKTILRLPLLIETFKSNGKDVILASNTVEFNDKDNYPLFDWYMLNRYNKFSVNDMNNLFYENINEEVSGINLTVAMIAKQHSIRFVEKNKLICSRERKQCSGMTPDGYKSFYDYGHWTLQGAKYFGMRMIAINWLELDKK